MSGEQNVRNDRTKVPPRRQQLSAGAMNSAAAATALGYGANWLPGWFSFDRDVLDRPWPWRSRVHPLQNHELSGYDGPHKA
jgi:hypothetical protein